MIRSSSATWKGTGKNGEGRLTSQASEIASLAFDFQSRFSQDSSRVNPEELIAAAHAIDFVMKLSFILGEAGFVPLLLNATSDIALVNGSITASHLSLIAEIPGITQEIFNASVKEAKSTCPVSRVLNLEITSEVKLINIPGNNQV
jgi:lipoyl-dependent peroxiredoxin